MRKKHPYYNFARLDSYNATLNFCCGARGLGKTFGAKKKAIKDAIENGNQFIYLRRYKEELKAARGSFFTDIEVEDIFPKYDFRVAGNLAQYATVDTRGEDKRTWKTIGFFIALSTSQNNKSVSYARVKTIIFDEFIIEKGAVSYLTDEVKTFINFFYTVDRGQDKTKAYLLSNAVTIMNPYFLKYAIVPDKDVTNEIIKRANGYMVCHFPDAKDFQNSIYETDFGKFIKEYDPEYADYAVGNTFSDNNDNLLGIKNTKARYLYTLECKTGTFSVWFDFFKNNYYIQERLPVVQTKYTLLSDRMAEDKTLLTFSDVPLQRLRTAFRKAEVIFDTPTSRNSFAEIFKR